MEVSAKVRSSPAFKDKDGKEQPAVKGGEVKVNFTLPADLAGLQRAYTDPVVYAHAKGSMIISLQALLRRMIEAGKSQAECQAATTGWKPDVRTAVKQTAFEKASGAIKSLNTEERAKLLKELTGK